MDFENLLYDALLEFGSGMIYLLYKQDYLWLDRSSVQYTAPVAHTYHIQNTKHLTNVCASQIIFNIQMLKCSSLMFIPSVIKLFASFRNSRFDGLVVPTFNVIGNDLKARPNTGLTIVLLRLNKGSPSMLRDKINSLFTASMSFWFYFFNASKIINSSPKWK